MEVFEAVFISDLHLHPDNPEISLRFEKFIAWASQHTRKLYILGDFFHAWAGDDSFDAWSNSIMLKLESLSKSGIELYFMQGNRDFLLGEIFAKKARLSFLKDPSIIQFGDENIMLSHGDRFCTKDRAHQIFMRVTRNQIFLKTFMLLPLSLRKKLVNSVRKLSQAQVYDPIKMSVVKKSMFKCMDKYRVKTLIHGHTHRPGLTKYPVKKAEYNQYILSDWDDRPQILCYDNTKGFLFMQF